MTERLYWRFFPYAIGGTANYWLVERVISFIELALDSYIVFSMPLIGMGSLNSENIGFEGLFFTSDLIIRAVHK